MEKQVIFTSTEIAECAQAALDNWNWDEEVPFAAERQQALTSLAEHPDMICEEGQHELGRGYRDIWDFLANYAESTAQNIVAARD